MDKYNNANSMDESTKEAAKKKRAAIKEAQKELDLFHKKAYDYIQARKLVKQESYYSNWNDIFTVKAEPETV
ncbi:MAG: hypothetical protein LIO43_01905 [Clostridiales bacterium]|nr:hypothetical protein [Clostridiales bacterium]